MRSVVCVRLWMKKEMQNPWILLVLCLKKLHELIQTLTFISILCLLSFRPEG